MPVRDRGSVPGEGLDAFDEGNAGGTNVGLDLHEVSSWDLVDKGDTGGLEVGLGLHGLSSWVQSTKGMPAAWRLVLVFMV